MDETVSEAFLLAVLFFSDLATFLADDILDAAEGAADDFDLVDLVDRDGLLASTTAAAAASVFSEILRLLLVLLLLVFGSVWVASLPSSSGSSSASAAGGLLEERRDWRLGETGSVADATGDVTAAIFDADAATSAEVESGSDLLLLFLFPPLALSASSSASRSTSALFKPLESKFLLVSSDLREGTVSFDQFVTGLGAGAEEEP